MKTKEKIKIHALEQFNENGFNHVTLRDIAKEMNKSYGNITYHFSKKIVVIQALYEDLLLDLEQLFSENFVSEDLNFTTLLQVPESMFDLSKKYSFFYTDFIDLRRVYPDFYENVMADNEKRKARYLDLLTLFQKQGFIRSELSQQDLNFLMELSGMARTFFFMQAESVVQDAHSYSAYVNAVLKPYLSQKGLKEYDKFIKSE